MKRKNYLYIKDIIEAIGKIEEFIQDMNFDKFVQDDKTASAVIRKLEIIGEATKHLSEDVKKRFENIPWTAMAKTRDKIIHFYHGVDYEIIWKIIKEELPNIKQSFQEIYDLLIREENR